MRMLNVVAVLVLLDGSPLLGQQNLSLDGYLQQVRSKNDAVRASELTMAGAYQKSHEGSLAFTPQLFSTLQHSDDKRQTNNPAFQGEQTVIDTAVLGVSQQFRFGLQSKLSYSASKIEMKGVNPTMVPMSDFYDALWTLELTQPLLKNAFGRASRAQEEAARAQNNANRYQAAFQKKALLADAESRYWRLAITRELVKVQNQTYASAQKLRDYNARKARLQLADRADLLQAEAAMKGREMELQAAANEERSAMRSFNAARGINSDKVSEALELPSFQSLQSLPVPQRARVRDDVKAAHQAMKAAVAAGEVGKDRYKPQLDLFASLVVEGKDPEFPEANDKAQGGDYPYTVVGLRFNMPLGGKTGSIEAGYQKDIAAAQLNYKRKFFEQETDWNELISRFNEAKGKLKLAIDFVDAQKAKLEAERKRQRDGRSTLFQVLLFEQDYLNAELNKLQTQSAILNLLSQMKTFQGAV